MQAADPGKADDVGWRADGTLLDRSPERGILAYPDVRAVPVVLVDERVEQPAQARDLPAANRQAGLPTHKL